MKKKFLTLALALCSSAALAGNNGFHKNHSTDAVVEVSVVGQTIDTASGDLDGDGLRLNYERNLTGALGLHFRTDFVDFDNDADANLTVLGLTYALPLKTKSFTVSPEVGLYRLDIEDEDEVSPYVGLNLSGKVFYKELSYKVFARHYDDDILGEDNDNQYGVKLTYLMDRSIGITAGYEDFGDLTSISLGLSYKF